MWHAAWQLHHSIAHGNSSLNTLRQSTRDNITAIAQFHTILHCVLLNEVEQQRNPHFIELLTRLWFGTCTVSGVDSDFAWLETELLKWINDPNHAAPLITYTNSVRNLHNWNMTKATGQDFHVYHAEDSVQGPQRSRVLLTGQNAEDA